MYQKLKEILMLKHVNDLRNMIVACNAMLIAVACWKFFVLQEAGPVTESEVYAKYLFLQKHMWYQMWACFAYGAFIVVAYYASKIPADREYKRLVAAEESNAHKMKNVSDTK